MDIEAIIGLNDREWILELQNNQSNIYFFTFKIQTMELRHKTTKIIVSKRLMI